MAKTFSRSIERGATLKIPVSVTQGGAPKVLTGATITAKMQLNAGGQQTSLTVTPTNLALGQFELSLTDEQTDTLAPGKYSYDVKVELAGEVAYYINGTITITQVVTE